MRILHAALPRDWERAKADGSYDVSTRGVSLTEEGFIHAATVAQIAGVLDRYYADVEMVDLLLIDLDRLDHEGANVVWETPPGAADGPYPHVYGVVPAQTVVDVVRLAHVVGEPWQVPPMADVATGPTPA